MGQKFDQRRMSYEYFFVQERAQSRCPHSLSSRKPGNGPGDSCFQKATAQARGLHLYCKSIASQDHRIAKHQRSIGQSGKVARGSGCGAEDDECCEAQESSGLQTVESSPVHVAGVEMTQAIRRFGIFSGSDSTHSWRSLQGSGQWANPNRLMCYDRVCFPQRIGGAGD